MVASCCVARKIRLSPCSAASSALTEDSRPITKGTIMKGKITTSRMGTIGSLVCSYFSFVLISMADLICGLPSIPLFQTAAEFPCFSTISLVMVSSR